MGDTLLSETVSAASLAEDQVKSARYGEPPKASKRLITYCFVFAPAIFNKVSIYSTEAVNEYLQLGVNHLQ